MQSVFCSILLYPILFRNTLPSDYGYSRLTTTYNFSVGAMMNGSHVNSTTSSQGSYYNQFTASGGGITSTAMHATYQYNICPSNWTFPSYSQSVALANTGITAWQFGANATGTGWYTSGGPSGSTRLHWRIRDYAPPTTLGHNYWYCLYSDTGSSNKVSGIGSCSNREGGFPIRCLAK